MYPYNYTARGRTPSAGWRMLLSSLGTYSILWRPNSRDIVQFYSHTNTRLPPGLFIIVFPSHVPFYLRPGVNDVRMRNAKVTREFPDRMRTLHTVRVKETSRRTMEIARDIGWFEEKTNLVGPDARRILLEESKRDSGGEGALVSVGWLDGKRPRK